MSQLSFVQKAERDALAQLLPARASPPATLQSASFLHEGMARADSRQVVT